MKLSQIKNIIKFNDELRDRKLKRMTALTLQTCILNVASLLASGCASMLLTMHTVFVWVRLPVAADVVQNIYNNYLSVPQYAVVILNSNIGFIVHCCYSLMYREAMQETFAAVKAACKKKFKNATNPQTEAILTHTQYKYSSTTINDNKFYLEKSLDVLKHLLEIALLLLFVRF